MLNLLIPHKQHISTSQMIVRSLRDLVASSKVPRAIENIILKSCEDLVCRNLFCEKIGKSCLCRLEHALASPFVDLTSVKSVNLSSNKLESLPPSISKMNNLEELDISENSFTELPHFLLSLDKLSRVNISSNPVEKRLGLSILDRSDLLKVLRVPSVN